MHDISEKVIQSERYDMNLIKNDHNTHVPDIEPLQQQQHHEKNIFAMFVEE